MKKFGIKEVAATAIGTALFVALTEVEIPLIIVPDVSLHIRAALLAFLATVFGPITGGVIGFVGHALGDAIFSGSVWWSWVIPEAVLGIAIGIFSDKFKNNEADFDLKAIAMFNLIQVIANVVAWMVVAPVLDILLYGDSASKVFMQGAIACLANVITIGVLGTLLGIVYTKIGLKSLRLTK